MKYKVLNMPKSFLSDLNESDFIKQSLYYINDDEKLMGSFFKNDELYEISTSSYYLKVVGKIKKVINEKKKILISGDYDCDGICATTLLYRYLKSVNDSIGYYIPHRKNDGYGLSIKLVDMYHAKGYEVIICVDNGVVAHEAIAYAYSLGMEVIILDHHEMDDLSLNYEYVLHPLLMEEPYNYMCGSGIVFEVLRSFKLIDEYDIILAALATISDMMLLAYENRAIVRLGIINLNRHKDLHLTSLMEDANVIDETTLAIRIAPKINAVGRMYDLANANNVVKYLLSDNTNEIIQTANQILNVNEERRKITRSLTTSLTSNIDLDKPYILLASEIHEGIVGLIASSMVNTYEKLSIVLSLEDGIYKGSCRSINGVDLVDMMRNCPYLESFGGHKQAGGLSLKEENLSLLEEYVNQYLNEHEVVEEEKLVIEVPYFTMSEVLRLQALRPFLRVQNEPLYLIRNLNLDNAVLLKDGKHAKWPLDNDSEVIYFNISEEIRHFNNVNYVCKLAINEFRGKKKVSLNVVDYFI